MGTFDSAERVLDRLAATLGREHNAEIFRDLRCVRPLLASTKRTAFALKLFRKRPAQTSSETLTCSATTFIEMSLLCDELAETTIWLGEAYSRQRRRSLFHPQPGHWRFAGRVQGPQTPTLAAGRVP